MTKTITQIAQKLQIKRTFNSSLPVVIIIVLMNFIIYAKSITGYFLADDFIHVTYLADVFSGHPEKLLANFYGNWMQTEGTQFYRPLISISLALDYLLGGANSLSFHLSNIIFQAANSVLVFLILKRLLKEDESQLSANISAICAGLLFTFYPLHPEVVSWVIGRVDSISCLFILLSIYFYLTFEAKTEKETSFSKLSLLFFSAGLMSKEMAITVPPVVFMHALLYTNGNIVQRLTAAFRKSLIYFAFLLAYLGLRFVFLGTLFGGYNGSIGEGLSKTMFKRWFLDYSLLITLFPFSGEFFSPNCKAKQLLKIIYLTSGGLLFLRMLLMRAYIHHLKHYLFLLSWIILSLIPTYQVWNLSSNLQGSRFFYLASAPFLMLLAIFLLPKLNTLSKKALASKPLTLSTVLVSLILAGIVIYTFAATTYKNNTAWVRAGNIVRAFRSAVEVKLNTLSKDQKILLLNIPQRVDGAHMIYNAAMLNILLSPPLSPNNIYPQVYTLEPATYGDADLLNISVLKSTLDKKDLAGIYYWDSENLKLMPIDFQVTKPQEDVEANPESNMTATYTLNKPLHDSEFLVSPLLNRSTLRCDTISVRLSARANSSRSKSSAILCLSSVSKSNPILSLTDCLSKPIADNKDSQLIIFDVSEHKSWVKSGTIEQIALYSPASSQDIIIESVVLDTLDLQSPKISLSKQTEKLLNCDGIVRLSQEDLGFDYDGSNIEGCRKIRVELSKHNSWFEHYSGTFRDRQASTNCLKFWQLNQNKGQFSLANSDYPVSGFYQLRVFALDDRGSVIGISSDPINLQVSISR